MSFKDKKKIDLSTLVYGKVPPQARQLEEAIIGAMILNPSLAMDVFDILKPFDFYDNINMTIAECIYKRYKSKPLDMFLVAEYLRQDEKLDLVGGIFNLTKLTNNVTGSDSANIKEHSRIVKEKSIQRTLIEIASIIINESYEETTDVFEILSQAEYKLRGVNIALSESNITTLGLVASKVIDKIRRKRYYNEKNEVDPDAIYTGMPEWDRVNGRLFPAVYIVAGRPAMGKGVHMTECICRMGKKIPVGVINGEMTHEQLLIRIACNLKNINNYLFKKEDISQEEEELIVEAMQEAISLNLSIDGNRNIEKIANKIMMWKNEGVKVVFADFLTAFEIPEELAKYMTPVQQVNYILGTFVWLAKELEIPIILYAQMNREILKRGSREPNLGDLKDSGRVEEFAFQVSFLHRPEYYDPNLEEDEFGVPIRGLMYQIIAKHRDGELARIKYKAILSKSKLEDWEDSTTIGWKPSTQTTFLPKQGNISFEDLERDIMDGTDDEASPF